MNSARWLLGLSTTFLMIAASAGGCSNSSSSSNDAGPGDDATADVETPESSTNDSPSTDAPADSGPACHPDSSILNLPVPDADVSCISCLNQTSTCGAVFQQCANDCTCAAAYPAFLTCLSTATGMQGFIACGGTFAASVPGGQGALLGCVGGCVTICSGGTTSDGGDAGPGDSGPGDSGPGDSAPGDSAPGDSAPGDSAPADAPTGG